MANRYLIASGSVLDPTNLDGSVALAVGDVLRANGFTGTIDDETPALDYISVNAFAPAAAGGEFRFAQGGILNADVAPPDGHSRTLYFPAGIAWAVLNGGFIGGYDPGGIERYGVVQDGTGNLIVNGLGKGGSALGTFGNPYKSGLRINGGRLDIVDVEGGTAAITTASNWPAGVWRAGGEVYIHGRAKAGACPAVIGAVEEVEEVESVLAIPALIGGNATGGTTKVHNKIILKKSSTAFPFGNANWEFTGVPTIELVFIDDSVASLSTNPDSTLAPNEVKKDVVFDNGSKTGTLEVVDTAQLATDLFAEIVASSDPLAVRLKNTATVSTVNDAIGSLNVIP